jgi:hypothetical protein
MAEGTQPTRDDVLAAYGTAMLAAQQFEESMVGLAGVRTEIFLGGRDQGLTNNRPRSSSVAGWICSAGPRADCGRSFSSTEI